MRKKDKYISVLLTLSLLLLAGCQQSEPYKDAESNEQAASAEETEPIAENESTGGFSEEPAVETADEPTEAATEKPAEEAQEAPTMKSAIAYPSTSGKLKVSGSKLVDQNGNPVQLKGISTHGINIYSNYVNEACFKQFREEWNVNVMRLAMYTAENGGYCVGGNQEELKHVVRDGIQYATNQDMYVIVDWHILSDSNPLMYQNEAIAFFEEISSEYADYDNVIYEICNEPNSGTSWNDIKTYANAVIPVIRANDADAVIIVGTPNWSQYVNEAAADPITGYDNIMYTLHFYAATHKQELRDTMKAAIDAGLPIFVSEYGICDASGNGGLDYEQADLWVKEMNEYGISYLAWNLSNKDESSAILNNSCTKTSGFTDDDLNESGKWLKNMLTTE